MVLVIYEKADLLVGFFVFRVVTKDTAVPFLEEDQASSIKIYDDQVAHFNLNRGQKTGNGINHMALYGPFQMAGTILDIRAFPKQKSLSIVRYAEHKAAPVGIQYAALHHPEFNVKYPLQMLRRECMKHDSFVNAVHELRCELPLGGIDSGFLNLMVKTLNAIRENNR